MKSIAILIHGFNVWDGGRGSVGKLRPFFADLGAPYVMVNYGHFGLLDTRFKNRKIAHRVADAVTSARVKGFDNIVVVGHSNGCAIAHIAATCGAQIDRAVFINPALKKDIEIPASIKSLDVWHSPSDIPVRLARYLLPSGARPWGRMGADGYAGNDSRVRNFNKETDYQIESREHSDAFDIERITYFGPLIAGLALDGAKHG